VILHFVSGKTLEVAETMRELDSALTRANLSGRTDVFIVVTPLETVYPVEQEPEVPDLSKPQKRETSRQSIQLCHVERIEP
jgi:hypothetical protein